MVQNPFMSMVKIDLVFSFIRDILSGQRIQFYRQYYFSCNFDCTVLFSNFIFWRYVFNILLIYFFFSTAYLNYIKMVIYNLTGTVKTIRRTFYS